MSRPKLLYVATEDWYFVSDTLPLAKAARAAGYDVFVAARANGKDDIIRASGLDFIPLGRMARSSISPFSQAAGSLELKDLYERMRPALVHHIALKPILYGQIAARALPEMPVINSVMGLGFIFASATPTARVLRPLVRQRLRGVLARPKSRTLVQNSDDRDELAALSPAGADRIRLVLGSGVDHRRFAASPQPDGPPIVVLPARLLRPKGVAEFAGAARILKAEGLAARFALVGEPDDENHDSVSRAEIAAWVNEGIIEHWGFCGDMPAVYREASAVCLPTYYREGLPRVLLEAAASARAIVATDVPGCREIARPGVNGWLVPPRDAAALAAALREAIQEPRRRARFGEVGRLLIEGGFTADQIIAQTLGIYGEVQRLAAAA